MREIERQLAEGGPDPYVTVASSETLAWPQTLSTSARFETAPRRSELPTALAIVFRAAIR